ncbi:MAG: DUF4142 domain-containing protein [Pseudomonadota bacterium]
MNRTPRTSTIFRVATPLILAASLAACGSMGGSRTSSSASPSSNSNTSASSSGTMAAPSMASSRITAPDQQLVNEIGYANLAEISTGQLALTKSQDPKVRAYAQRMIDDHTRAMGQLKTLAQSKGGTVPTETDLKNKAIALELSALSGGLFDRQYMSQAGVGAHKRTHELIENVQRNANDPALRAHASMIMPVVHSHLTEAQTMTGK